VVRPRLGLALVLAALAGAPAAQAAVGDLTQLTGTLGCTVQTDGSGLGCASGTSLIQPEAIAVSADGKNAYVATALSDAVTIFDRDPSTGTITQKANPDGCVSDDDTSGGTCIAGKALFFAIDVAVSPDGKSVYVNSSEGLAVLNRDADTGGLTVPAVATAGCFTDDGSNGDCTAALGVSGGGAVAVSPDNKNVYVVGADSLASFTRDLDTGALTYTGCFKGLGGPIGCPAAKAMYDPRSVTIPSDGKGVYVTAASGDSIAIFNRDAGGVLTQPQAGTAGCVSEDGTDGNGIVGACKDVNYVSSSFSMAFTSDGRDAYVSDRAQYAIGEFSRDPDTNELTQKPAPNACLTAASIQPPDCGVAKAITYPTGVAVSADGKSVYMSAQEHGLALFDRDTSTGYLTQKAGTAGCITKDGTGGTCAQARAINKPWDVAINPDDKAVYVVGQTSNSVSVFGRETVDGPPNPGGGDPGTGTPGTGDPGTGPPSTPRPPAPARPHVTTVTLHYNSINGSLSVEATATGPGTVTMNADGSITVSGGHRAQAAKKVKLKIASAKKVVKKAGKVTLTLKPKGKAKSYLRKHGKLKGTLHITFKPKAGGKASVKTKKVTFKYKRRP